MGSSRPKAQGGLHQGQTQGQGGSEGPSWRTSRQAWAAGPGLEPGPHQLHSVPLQPLCRMGQQDLGGLVQFLRRGMRAL